MQKYRFGVLLLGGLLSARGAAGIHELGVWAGPSGSAAASRPLLVTGAPLLQQGMLVQSYFPGQVPRVSLLHPPLSSNFVDICGFALKAPCLTKAAPLKPQPALESG